MGKSHNYGITKKTLKNCTAYNFHRDSIQPSGSHNQIPTDIANNQDVAQQNEV